MHLICTAATNDVEFLACLAGIYPATAYCCYDLLCGFVSVTQVHYTGEYLRSCFAPTLKEGDMVIMGNLTSHKLNGLKGIMEERGARIEYLRIVLTSIQLGHAVKNE